MNYELVISYNDFADNGLGSKTKVIKSDDYEKVINTLKLWLGEVENTNVPMPKHYVSSVRWRGMKPIFAPNSQAAAASKAGKASVARLTPEQLSERGKKAAAASAAVRAKKKRIG